MGAMCVVLVDQLFPAFSSPFKDVSQCPLNSLLFNNNCRLSLQPPHRGQVRFYELTSCLNYTEYDGLRKWLLCPLLPPALKMLHLRFPGWARRECVNLEMS